MPATAIKLINAVIRKEYCHPTVSDINVAKGTPNTVATVRPENIKPAALDCSSGNTFFSATDNATDQYTG